MTGTPVENSAEDLVGIFEFLSPGLLHSDWSPRRIGREAAEYILRRTKDEVLTDMPPKLFRDAEIDLTPAQRHTYDIAEKEGHHPDLHVAWGKCTVEIWTHKIDGLTESDFYLAAKADRAL